MTIKRFSLLLLPAVLLSTSVFATTVTQGFTGSTVQQQGFHGPSHALNTVKSVLDAGMFSDDTPVTLTGKITRSLGGEHYTFTDGSGSITVEIDHDKWFGIQVTPNTKIMINGEIDKEFTHTTIDVDYIRIEE